MRKTPEGRSRDPSRVRRQPASLQFGEHVSHIGRSQRCELALPDRGVEGGTDRVRVAVDGRLLLPFAWNHRRYPMVEPGSDSRMLRQRTDVVSRRTEVLHSLLLPTQRRYFVSCQTDPSPLPRLARGFVAVGPDMTVPWTGADSRGQGLRMCSSWADSSSGFPAGVPHNLPLATAPRRGKGPGRSAFPPVYQDLCPARSERVELPTA